MSGQVGGTHYQGTGIEPFQVINAWDLDFYRGSALKYIMRAGKKDGVSASEDLRKAVHYLTEAAERAETAEAGSPKPAPVYTVIEGVKLYRCWSCNRDLQADRDKPHKFPSHYTSATSVYDRDNEGEFCDGSGSYLGNANG